MLCLEVVMRVFSYVAQKVGAGGRRIFALFLQ